MTGGVDLLRLLADEMEGDGELDAAEDLRAKRQVLIDTQIHAQRRESIPAPTERALARRKKVECVPSPFQV